MRSIRRIGGAAVAGLLLGGIATGGPAVAQTTTTTPASYTGAATARALQLAIATQSTTEGASTAKATSGGTSEATGAGVVGQANQTATAKNPPGQTVPDVCADKDLNAVEAQIRSLIVLGAGCGSASATGSDLATVATATGKVGSLDVNLQNLALPLPPLVAPAQVTAAATAACNALPTSLPGVPVPGVTVPNPRQACLDLLNTTLSLPQNILSTKTLEAKFGESTSGVSVSGTTVTSESTASGATINILPAATLNGVPLGEPLATISISRANAKVLCNLDTGAATPSFDPAIVRVKLASALASALPALPDLIPKQTIPATPLTAGEIDVAVLLTEDGSFTVTPGAKVVLFPGLPIQTEIVAGAGTSKVNPDGSATSVADGVKVHLLQNIGTVAAPLTGGILANLAHAEAAGACVAATSSTTPAPAPPVPEVSRELPRTGPSDAPWLPMAGVAGLALAVMSRRAVLRTR